MCCLPFDFPLQLLSFISALTGQFLVDRLLNEGLNAGFCLVFVWNRNADKLKDSVPNELVLTTLSEFVHKYVRAHVHLHTSEKICALHVAVALQVWIYTFCVSGRRM